jgi:hypothetical protein
MKHAEVHARGVGDLAHGEAGAAAGGEELTPGDEQGAVEISGRARRHGRNYTNV